MERMSLPPSLLLLHHSPPSISHLLETCQTRYLRSLTSPSVLSLLQSGFHHCVPSKPLLYCHQRPLCCSIQWYFPVVIPLDYSKVFSTVCPILSWTHPPSCPWGKLVCHFLSWSFLLLCRPSAADVFRLLLGCPALPSSPILRASHSLPRRVSALHAGTCVSVCCSCLLRELQIQCPPASLT